MSPEGASRAQPLRPRRARRLPATPRGAPCRGGSSAPPSTTHGRRAWRRLRVGLDDQLERVGGVVPIVVDPASVGRREVVVGEVEDSGVDGTVIPSREVSQFLINVTSIFTFHRHDCLTGMDLKLMGGGTHGEPHWGRARGRSERFGPSVPNYSAGCGRMGTAPCWPRRNATESELRSVTAQHSHPASISGVG